MKKRQIDETLVDVWAEMMAEKIDRAKATQMGTEDPIRCAGLAGYVDGLTQALALMSSLENGRFAKDYERLRKEMMEDGR